jgi:hypothetical protein
MSRIYVAQDGPRVTHPIERLRWDERLREGVLGQTEVPRNLVLPAAHHPQG